MKINKTKFWWIILIILLFPMLLLASIGVLYFINQNYFDNENIEATYMFSLMIAAVGEIAVIYFLKKVKKNVTF